MITQSGYSSRTRRSLPRIAAEATVLRTLASLIDNCERLRSDGEDSGEAERGSKERHDV
jgi:hypothetical protein